MTVNTLRGIGRPILLLVTCGFSKTFWTRKPRLRVKAAPAVANTTALPSFTISPLTTAPLSSTVRAILNQGIAAGRGIGQFDNSQCTLVGNPAGNINLRCDERTHPLAETAIAVDPNDPNHLLVGANNFNLAARGSQIAFFVSFDGGSAWTSGQILANAAGAADPSPAFNAKFGTVHMAHIGVDCSGGCTSAEVSTSTDGGLTWGNPVDVARGERLAFLSQHWLLNDKPWLVCDNNPGSPHYGRLYLTWTRIGPIYPSLAKFRTGWVGCELLMKMKTKS